MSTETITTELSTDPGVLLGADLPGTATKPRWGQRAAMIRKLALRYPELNHTEIAGKVGCNPRNVDQVLGRFLGKELFSDVGDFQTVKASAMEAVQFRTLASITAADIAKTPFIQRVTAFAILQDKIQLMRGQPTAIHAHVLVDVLAMLREQETE